MPRITKTQMKNRLNEAKAKVMAVYTGSYMHLGIGYPTIVTTADMAAIEKIIDKCLKRLN